MSTITASVEKKLWTYADYIQNTPEDNIHREVIAGELIVSPSPNLNHQRTLTNLAYIVIQFVKEHHLGQVFIAPMDVVLNDTNILQPDLLFVPTSKKELLSNRKNVWGAPEWVVEIISPRTRRIDRTTKAGLYASYAVSEYWIIDPDEQTIDVFVLERGVYREREFAEGEVQSQVLAGLTVKLSDVFEDLD